jgi:MHS family proline/betaine transporter-like MFS transporter
VFAVGFGMRPLGAILFGILADRRGRRTALIAVIMTMGVATLAVGLVPPYAQVGVLGPVLLVAARSAQGVAVGGEFGTSAPFLVEYAPRSRRGMWGSVTYVGSGIGNALAAAVVLGVTLLVARHDLQAWGWRVPFLLGFPLVAVGFYMRLRIEETPSFEAIRASRGRARSPLLEAARDHWREMLVVVGAVLAFAVTAYTVLTFMLTYLSSVRGLSRSVALLLVLVAILLGVVLAPLFGWASDVLGRGRVLMAGCAGTVVLYLPGYALIGLGTVPAVLAGLVLFMLPLGVFQGVTPAAFSEIFPTRVRASGFSVAYGIGTALFSGTTPFILTLLVTSTHNPLSPAWYPMVCGVISLGVLVAARGMLGMGQPRAALQIAE